MSDLKRAAVPGRYEYMYIPYATTALRQKVARLWHSPRRAGPEPPKKHRTAAVDSAFTWTWNLQCTELIYLCQWTNEQCTRTGPRPPAGVTQHGAQAQAQAPPSYTATGHQQQWAAVTVAAQYESGTCTSNRVTSTRYFASRTLKYRYSVASQPSGGFAPHLTSLRSLTCIHKFPIQQQRLADGFSTLFYFVGPLFCHHHSFLFFLFLFFSRACCLPASVLRAAAPDASRAIPSTPVRETPFCVFNRSSSSFPRLDSGSSRPLRDTVCLCPYPRPLHRVWARVFAVADSFPAAHPVGPQSIHSSIPLFSSSSVVKRHQHASPCAIRILTPLRPLPLLALHNPLL
ncbi:uncharacterized protein Triagg1_5395 [Trichoderma aggressivum f. europaeum]|uniref:Uncharacterized protein n=1 Tax=Trichoderma aggressivum f. europaeum TaxID=173218 RepID=A0AAE1ICY7_9HYPO|nr:hypothetical protein Triagg1_5395 [Trichoderma aggressivum f. europaeum]